MNHSIQRFAPKSNPVSVCLKAISFLCVLMITATASAQDETPEEMVKRMREKQSQMMETQFLMQQLMQLGFNSELRKELEIVDDQVESVKKLAQDYQNEMLEFQKTGQKFRMEIQKLVDDGDHEKARELSMEFQEKNQTLADRYIELASETLLPHQIVRLKQISKQQRVKGMSQFQDEFGIAASMADEIGLTEDEKSRLIEIIKDARKQYYEEVESAKKVANEKIMGALTAEQKEKLRELIGETYNQEEMRRRSREEMLRQRTKSPARN